MESPGLHDWVPIEGEGKQCPLCAESIKAEATLCHYCGAKFEVVRKGYCKADHQQVELDEAGCCSRCRGEVIDSHLESRLVQPIAPEAGQQVAPSGPTASDITGSTAQAEASPAGISRRPGCVTAYALLTGIVALAMLAGGIVGGITLSEDSLPGGLTMAATGILLGAMFGALAGGLWNLRPWARTAVIILQSLSLVAALFALVRASMLPSSLPSGPPTSTAGAFCGGLVSFGIQLSILNWFRRNKRLFDPRAPAASAPGKSPAEASGSPAPRSKVWIGLGIVGALAVVLIGTLLLFIATRSPRMSGGSPRAATTATRTLAPTATTRPTATDRPTRTATPPPVEITFDEIGSLPTGTDVILTGRLALFSSTRCGLTCGLLLEDIANPAHEIAIFVYVASPGQTAEPNHMNSLPDPYVKSDIRVRTDDGTYAAVGFRIRVTGEICETTTGKPCISDITRIELVTVD